MTKVKTSKTERNFPAVTFALHPYEDLTIQESSTIDDTERGLNNPGSSYLWIGKSHLDREEVEDLITYLQNWVSKGTIVK